MLSKKPKVGLYASEAKKLLQQAGFKCAIHDGKIEVAGRTFDSYKGPLETDHNWYDWKEIEAWMKDH